jgi:hypothetical protein
MHGLSPEAQFLLQRARLKGPNSDDIRRTIPPNLNWDVLLQLAQRHSMVPLLHRSFGRLSADEIPQEILDRCRTQTSKISGRNLVLKRELVAILRMLQADGIAVIPYKGPVLTERLYGNIGLRHFDDLDLLVHRKDVLRVKELLLLNGYSPKKDLAKLTPSQEKAFLQFQYSYDFTSGTSGNQLEVHWGIVAKTFSLDLDYESIWNRCSTVAFENLMVPVFCPEDLLLILSITGAKKVWDRLSRVYDVARALQIHPDMGWDLVTQQAGKAGAQRILHVGLSLASTLFEAPVPASFQQWSAQDPEVRTLTGEIVDRMFTMQDESHGLFRPEDQFQPIHCRIRERFSDRVRYCLRAALTPGVGEWSVIELPGFAHFLYYFIRPVRLISKTVSRIFVRNELG